jgi:phospholipase C
MRGRTGRFCWSGPCLVCLMAIGAGQIGCGSGAPAKPSPPPSFGKIQHIVLIIQENRTPDNLFHGFPNADIANSGVNSVGQTITLTPITLANDYDLSHQHSAFLDMFDNGKMDGADKIVMHCGPGAKNCPQPFAQFHYADPAEVQPYFQMAQQYTFADRMFQTNQGPSFPAHQFILAGTSAPTAASLLFAAENVVLPLGARSNTAAGCAGPVGETVAMIDPMGSEAATQFPCFDHPTLIDSLDANGITWRYYAPSAGSIWTAPNAIHHLRFGNDWQNVIIPQINILTDIASGQLPQMAWVIPDGRASDHALQNDGSGPSWVASIVNAIGNSSYWSNTAIIVTWDDWGGWYDHVAPKILNSYEYGFRVPLIIVSPYAKTRYVSHVTHDFGSLLHFTEVTFHLPSLGYADSIADDLSDCFDFAQTPTSFQPFAAKFDAAYFILDRRPPTDPDDD